MQEIALTDMISIASFSLALFGAALCLMQDQNVWPYRILSMVLLASAVMDLTGIPFAIENPLAAARLEAIFLVLGLVCLTCLVPLFWLYVTAVTSVTPRLPARPWLHLTLPFIAAAIATSTLFMSRDGWQSLFVETAPSPTGWYFTVAIIGELLIIATILQWGAYLVAIIRALMRYRRRLFQYVSTTTKRELRWVWVVIGGFAIYWIVSAASVVFDLANTPYNIPDWVDSVFGLAMLVIVLLWGLRQTPGLAPDVDPPAKDDAKYQNSALTDEMAKRLERKLRHAMTEDKLQQDPNLSLWSLSRHIGASPNYVSQTLNTEIGENFFDFVNRYRIQTAQKLLHETDRAVLEITYEVGFNSRSSFYTAFSKVTGETPTAYRKKMSVAA
ncbi:helix-turn-helix domain-containing protein [Yoonia sp. GPGPB17]|uniref:helix-turn-helix domain-containing protein n=1 Tax=Yoonia sp. GPGPB17 TaxID=3026147 RepID=UPI0030C3AA50